MARAVRVISLSTALKIGGAVAVIALAVGHVLGDQAVEAERDSWRSTAQRNAETARMNFKTADQWKSHFKTSEQNRRTEGQQATTAVNQANAACDARVARAKASAKAIKEIVNAPVPVDPRGCPVRQLVDAGSLRNALGVAPAAGGRPD